MRNQLLQLLMEMTSQKSPKIHAEVGVRPPWKNSRYHQSETVCIGVSQTKRCPSQSHNCWPETAASKAGGAQRSCPSPAPLHPNRGCPGHPPPQTSPSPGRAVEIPWLWPPPHAPSPEFLKTWPRSLQPEPRPPRSPTSHNLLTIAEEIMALPRWPEAEVGNSGGPGLHFPEPSAAHGII